MCPHLEHVRLQHARHRGDKTSDIVGKRKTKSEKRIQKFKMILKKTSVFLEDRKTPQGIRLHFPRDLNPRIVLTLCLHVFIPMS